MTRKLKLIIRGLLISALGAGSWIIWAKVLVSAHVVLHMVFPSLQEGDKEKVKKNQRILKSLTFFIQAEVLQGLVQVPSCGNCSDVPIRADRPQPRCTRTISHWCQTPTLCGCKI